MKKIIVSGLLTVSVFVSLGFACTDFQIKAKDGTVVIGRSMEFPIDLKSEICVVPRGNGKYGYIGINAFKLPGTYVEGFNEKGLSFDGLMFTGAVYQPHVAGQSIPLDNFAAWALGNFATVAEVKQALGTVKISDSSNKKLKDMGMHVAFHDAAGQNLVVEFIGGKVNIYDNPLGVMTNRPEFPWQLTNLRNYVNLNAQDKDSRMLNGVKIEATGVGSGLLGLPGDWTPPSRFVRTAFCVDAALPAKNAKEAVNLAEHILNVVDIPKGVIKENTPVPFVKTYGYAQWVLIKDLTNKVLYYKTYDDTAWKAVDLKKFDLTGSAVKSLPIDSDKDSYIDVSGELK